MITPQQERIENFIAWVTVLYFFAIIVVWLRGASPASPAPDARGSEIVAHTVSQPQTNTILIQDDELATSGLYAANHREQVAKEGK
jgi:hypothetical protein